jgi:hypothetical protein
MNEGASGLFTFFSTLSMAVPKCWSTLDGENRKCVAKRRGTIQADLKTVVRNSFHTENHVTGEVQHGEKCHRDISSWHHLQSRILRGRERFFSWGGEGPRES